LDVIYRRSANPAAHVGLQYRHMPMTERYFLKRA